VDKILQESFPDQWAEKEFRFTKAHWPYEDIKSWINETPDIKAYSSHTARMPLPQLDDIELFPIVFIRHPLIRLYSGYKYELEQDADTPGARKAKETNFKDYLIWRFGRPNDASARNFQANRFSHMFSPERGRLTEQDEVETHAMKALDVLPFVGLVERFDASIRLLNMSLERRGLDLKSIEARENINSDLSVSTEDRIKKIKAEIGDEVYETFEAKNAVDLKVYETVRQWYGA